MNELNRNYFKSNRKQLVMFDRPRPTPIWGCYAVRGTYLKEANYTVWFGERYYIQSLRSELSGHMIVAWIDENGIRRCVPVRPDGSIGKIKKMFPNGSWYADDDNTTPPQEAVEYAVEGLA